MAYCGRRYMTLHGLDTGIEVQLFHVIIRTIAQLNTLLCPQQPEANSEFRVMCRGKRGERMIELVTL